MAESVKLDDLPKSNGSGTPEETGEGSAERPTPGREDAGSKAICKEVAEGRPQPYSCCICRRRDCPIWQRLLKEIRRVRKKISPHENEEER